MTIQILPLLTVATLSLLILLDVQTDSRSPSAYKNAVDACINSLVEARFNIDMNTSTFADNIELYSCEGEGVNCNTEIAGSISNIGARRIAFSPTSNLSPNTWYRALIKTGVAFTWYWKEFTRRIFLEL